MVRKKELQPRYRQARQVLKQARVIIDGASAELDELIQTVADTPEGRNLARAMVRRTFYHAGHEFNEKLEPVDK